MFNNLKNKKGERKMKTVRERIENYVIELEKKYPSLITNQMDLGTGNHPDLDKYIWTEKQVGDDKLQKWKKFKYILKVWKDVDNGVRPIWDINYLFRTYGFYHYDKLLREERA